MRGQLLNGNLDDKIVIGIDVQNYYDCISIPTLMEKLSRHCKDSVQRECNFDVASRDQIVSFFSYLMSGNDGIPQADNDLISSFLGFLYLVFADLLIEDEIKEVAEIIDYQLIRYTDDMAICLTFASSISQERREQIVESLGSKVADLLYYELGLRLNDKTRMYWLGRENDRVDFEKSLKRVSPHYHVAADNSEDDPHSKVAAILDELQKLKNSRVTVGFRHELQNEVLKEVFDKRVRQLLSKRENLEEIGRIFTDFNFSLINVSPVQIMVVLLLDPGAKSRFRNYLLARNQFTTSDVYLLLTYLCQTDFSDDAILDRLRQYPKMQNIVVKFEEGQLSSECPGYYTLSFQQLQRLIAMPHVIEQIRLRVISEKRLQHSVALNHLLNEFHAICFELDDNRGKEKDYNAKKVATYLEARKVQNSICVSIRNLFDRRNANQVSHPGSALTIPLGVSEEEYTKYKDAVGKALQKLL